MRNEFGPMTQEPEGVGDGQWGQETPHNLAAGERRPPTLVKIVAKCFAFSDLKCPNVGNFQNEVA